MGFLNTKTSWSNAEFIPFKLCVASIYVIVGAYFHDFFQQYYVPLFILFGISVISTVYLWVKKMKDANGKSKAR
ncbi:MAG: hypothetical protein JO080_01730 [Mucilaginibacter sp.]|nr:hypothetical protein [Mucilaginibacter sp.]